jgi:hypothetical protein
MRSLPDTPDQRADGTVQPELSGLLCQAGDIDHPGQVSGVLNAGVDSEAQGSTYTRGSARKGARKPRLASCKVCRSKFEKRSITHTCCSIACSVDYARALRAKNERKETKQQREKLKTRRDWLKEAQVAFNAYIRERDKDKPCISCGRYHTGSYDAGHYRSVGAAPELRFNEDNCHRQCVPCNQHKSGNAVEYRMRLVERIGVARVEFLETEQPAKKYTIEDAQRIKSTYKAKLKELKGACEC